jgi:DNA-binding transcriptional ArsR family regulator
MKAFWQSREQADFAADKLRKFAQPQRLMILSVLREGEKSVTEIDLATRIGQPALSQQLAELRKGPVSPRMQLRFIRTGTLPFRRALTPIRSR